MDWTALALGAALGGVVLFVWYMVCWMGLWHHKADFRRIPDPSAVEEALERTGLSPGLYALPHMDAYEQGIKDPALAERMRRGPNALLTILRPGPAMSGKTFLGGFVLDLLEGFAVALLVAFLAPVWGGWTGSVGGGLLFGFLTSAGTYGALANWNVIPWRLCWTSTFDRTLGWAFVAWLQFLIGVGGAAA